MPWPPHPRKLSSGRIFLLVLALAAQGLGLFELHAEHGLASPASSSLVVAEACPSGTAPHVEASGPGRHAHPCHACFHGARSHSVASAPPPQIAPPAPALPVQETTVLPGTGAAGSSSGSRAPPPFS